LKEDLEMESRYKIGKSNLTLNLKARLKINLAFFICGLKPAPQASLLPVTFFFSAPQS